MSEFWIGKMRLIMTREDFEVLYKNCAFYYNAQQSNSKQSNKISREQIKKIISRDANCTESSADQYISLYYAMVQKRPFPKNMVGKDILLMMLEKIEEEYDESYIVSAINNAYVFFQYRYKYRKKASAEDFIIDIRKELQKYAIRHNVGLDFIHLIFVSMEMEAKKDQSEDYVEPEDSGSNEIAYTYSVDQIVAHQVPPPKEIVLHDASRKTIKAIDENAAAVKEKNKKLKGNRGEYIVLNLERARLMSLGREDLVARIKHVSQDEDGLGYDIESVDVDKKGKIIPIFIEVKTTAGTINRPFYISKREVDVSREKGKSYFIYRIFNMKENIRDVQYYVLQGAVEDHFTLTPVSYIAELKVNNEND